jgi:hypothetical protein
MTYDPMFAGYKLIDASNLAYNSEIGFHIQD